MNVNEAIFPSKKLKYKNHHFFELNCQTKEISIVSGILDKPYCLYTTALNKENAARKFLKMVRELPEKII